MTLVIVLIKLIIREIKTYRIRDDRICTAQVAHCVPWWTLNQKKNGE